MKLLQLVHGLPIGGTEVMVCHLVRGLRRLGVDVAVACMDQVGELGEGLKAEGVSVELLTRKTGLDRQLGRRIASLVRSGGFDLVHAHQYTCFVYGALAKPRSLKPLLFTEHGRFYPDGSSFKRRIFNYLYARRADRVTAVSEGVKQSLVKVEGFDARYIDVIYNGIELGRFSGAASRNTAEARASLGLRPNVKVVGTVARLDRIKNQAMLIHAIRALRHSGLDACLLVVGDGPELASLEAVTEQLGLVEHVRFLGKRSDVHKVLQAMDVFALSSFSEGTPMTLIEAMAARVPIVSTGVGGIPEIITDGKEGLLITGTPPDSSRLSDPAAAEYLGRFVAALRRLLLEEDLGNRLRQNALGRALKEFSLEVILEKYLSIYETLCRSSIQKAALR